MARLLRFLNSNHDMREVIFDLTAAAEENRIKEYKSAVIIQSWIRGVQTRCYLEHLSQMAVTIQKRWRGFIARTRYRNLVGTLHTKMRKKFYHAMAVRIQRVWRGFYSRKHKFDFYIRKKYFDALQVKNQIIRFELDNWRTQMNELDEKLRRKREKKQLFIEARRKHHLLSTVALPGVYNSPFRPDDAHKRIEGRMRASRPKHGEKAHRPKLDKFELYEAPRKPPKTLPPLKKVQGPFKSPEVVRQQRLKEIGNLIQGDFRSVDEQRKALLRSESAQVLAGPWKMDMGVAKVKYELYDPTTLTNENFVDKWRHVSRTHRDYKPEKWLGKNFYNSVKPVAIFSDLNNPYS